MKHRFDTITSDFICKHCHNHVSTDPILSGVNNRNHCPYCLYSRHMDHYEAGDRLSACKAEMRPVGLTLKKANKKYGKQQGELMIIHQCVDCGKISINRTAADDIDDYLLEIFYNTHTMNRATRQQIEQAGIEILDDERLVRARLFGWRGEPTGQALSFA